MRTPSDHYGTALRLQPRARDCAFALLGLACAPAACASYGNMRLDGIAFALAVMLLYLWSILLGTAVGVGLCKRKLLVIVATAVTAALLYLLFLVFGDGSATMGRRPLNLWAMFVVLLLVASPVMLTVPFLQFAAHARGTSGRIPIAMMIGAVVLAPVGSIVDVCVQEILEKRAHDQARALTPGTILAHVVAARQRAAGSWLSPYIWNEEAELKWIIIGVGRLGFVESPNPLSDEDTQALALLVQSSVGTGNAAYAWTLQAKLAWDSLMRAGANERPAIAAGLTPQQARSFNEYIGVPHADWLCASLADPPTEKAFNHVWTLLADHDRKQFSTGIQEKCGRSFGTVVTVESPVPRVRLRSSVTSPPIAR